jgi:hypothetical protein
VANDEKSRISGKEAAYVAAAKYPPVHISEVDSSANGSDGAAAMEKLPAPVSDQPGDGKRRQAPPRVRKPSPIHDQYLAPTPDLAGYSARLREPLQPFTWGRDRQRNSVTRRGQGTRFRGATRPVGDVTLPTGGRVTVQHKRAPFTISVAK